MSKLNDSEENKEVGCEGRKKRKGREREVNEGSGVMNACEEIDKKRKKSDAKEAEGRKKSWK